MIITSKKLKYHTWKCPKCQATISDDVKKCPICVIKRVRTQRDRTIKRIDKIENPKRKGTMDKEKLAGLHQIKFCYTCHQEKSAVNFRGKGWNKKHTVMLLAKKCRSCEARERWKKKLYST